MEELPLEVHARLEECERRLFEAVEIRNAIVDIMQAINGSADDVERVFNTILDEALKLCHAALGIVFLYEDGHYEA